MVPRIPRLEIPGVPLHVTQRGVNRCAIFHDDRDRRCYRKLL
jgi:putative transposase